MTIENSPDNDPPIELDPEYDAELWRRLEEIDSGRAKMLTLEEVMAGLHRRSTPPRRHKVGEPLR